MRRVKGFTLIELLVVIAIIGLLVSILVPSISQAQKLAKRAACAANLNGLGKTLAMYKGISDDSYPFISGNTKRKGSDGTRPGGFLYMDYEFELMRGGHDDPFALDGATPYEGTDLCMVENLCLLYKEKMVASWKMFRCPQISRQVMTRGDDDNNDYGFGGYDYVAYIDYAYHMGYHTSKDRNDPKNANRLRSRMNGGCIILGDQHGFDVDTDDGEEFSGPEGSSTETSNTGKGFNHGKDGINILSASYAVHFSKKILAGVNQNNIYTVDMAEDDDEPDGSVDLPAPGTAWNELDTILINPSDVAGGGSG